jgi:acetolactate synthase-1/2/3 large subunit
LLKKLSDYVIEFVAHAGVKHIFMLTGGGCMHLVDSVGRNPDLEYVCCLHEQACAFAAEAYAEYKGGLGAALVTSGPGGTNAVTGVAAAWLESASCLFISGQAKRADLIGSSGVRSMGQQEVDIVSVMRPITKYAVRILQPESIRYELERAVYLATNGRRGPVWIDIPLDVQGTIIDEATLQGFVPEPPAVANGRLERQVSQAIALLNNSQRPVLFLGNGARAADIGRFTDLLKIPVLATWKIIDQLPESNPYYTGRPGSIGQRGANFTQQNSDCLMVLGARLDRPQIAFSQQNFARSASKILVDIDPAEIAKFEFHIDISVCADAGQFVDEFLRQSDRFQQKDRTCWLRHAKDWHTKYPVVLPEYWEQSDGTVNSYVLMDVLSDELSSADVLVPGSSGPCSDIFMQAFRIKAGQRVVNAPGLGAMGTGLPGSIGACLASGRGRTICINGDGGFQLNIQELETVRRLHLPIKYFVLCNGAYASIMSTQRNYFDSRFVGSNPSGALTLPDITRVAAAYGLATIQANSHAGLRQCVREVLLHDGPVICAVSVSANEATAPRVTSRVRQDGVIVSSPMEDMWPFLSREEFQSNMIAAPPDQENP